jgi:hypothetical protein
MEVTSLGMITRNNFYCWMVIISNLLCETTTKKCLHYWIGTKNEICQVGWQSKKYPLLDGKNNCPLCWWKLKIENDHHNRCWLKVILTFLWRSNIINNIWWQLKLFSLLDNDEKQSLPFYDDMKSSPLWNRSPLFYGNPKTFFTIKWYP